MVIDQLHFFLFFFIKHNINDNSGVIVWKLVVRSVELLHGSSTKFSGGIWKNILSVIILY